MPKLVMPFGKVERTVPQKTAPRTPKTKGEQAKSAKRIRPSSLHLVMPPGRIERTVLRQIVKPKPKVKAHPLESAKRMPMQSGLTQSPVDAWLVSGVLPISLDPTSIETCALAIKKVGRARKMRYRAWLRGSIAFWYGVAIAIFDDSASFATIKDAPFIREARIGKMVDGKPLKEPSPLKRENLCLAMLQLGFDKHAASAYHRRVNRLWQEKADAREVLAFLQKYGLRDKPRRADLQGQGAGHDDISAPARNQARTPLLGHNGPPSQTPNRPSSDAMPDRLKVTMSGVLSGLVTIAAADTPEDTCVVITTVTKTASGKLEATSVLE